MNCKHLKMVKIAMRSLSEKEFADALNNQFNNLLKGGGLDDISIFRVSRKPLHGSGFLDFISGIGKFILPAVKRIIAPAAGEFAHGVINDMVSGKNFKSSLKKRGKHGLQKIGSKILHGKGLKRIGFKSLHGKGISHKKKKF